MTWWKRNRIWLALLIPILALALAASSFRLVSLYLPWQWSRPIVANDTSGVLRQNYLELDGVRRDREVRVSVLSLDAHESWGDAKAIDGGRLWRVELQLEAEPDQFLYGCEVELTDADGNRYDFRGGLEPVDAKHYFVAPVIIACAPQHALGPTVSPFTDEVVESELERPRIWEQEVLIAMPEGVSPSGLRIGWNRPVYLELELPE